MEIEVVFFSIGIITIIGYVASNIFDRTGIPDTPFLILLGFIKTESFLLLLLAMKKFRNVGNIDSRLKSLILKEANTLEKIVSSSVASIRARISNQANES